MPNDTPSTTPSLQKLFLTGLLTLFPIWLTWVVVKFVFVLLSGISAPLINFMAQQITARFPRTLGVIDDSWVQNTLSMIATLAVIVLVGLLARRVIGQRLLAWFEKLMLRIPLANIIYTSSRKLLDILQTKPGNTQRVVLIDFPHREMKSVGLVTRVMKEEGTGRELV